MRTNRKNRAILLAAISAGACSIGMAQTSVSWIGATLGTWNVNTNWSGGVFPNNGGTRYNAFIDFGAAPNVNVILNSTATINNLSISSGDMLTINPGFTLTMVGNDTNGNINNLGTIVLSGANSAINSTASISLDGLGTVLMNNASARFGGGGTFNNVNNLIIGMGAVGNGGLNLINSGTITANAGTLTLDPVNSSGMFNTGTLSAFSGGTLDISGTGGGSFSGAGTILASGGTVRLINSSNINGATFASSGGAAVIVPVSHVATLTNVNFTSDFQLANAAIASISGTCSNTGTITIASTGGNTALQTSGGVTLGGSGTIVMQGTGALLQGSGLIDTNNTIRGQGAVGSNQSSFIIGGSVISDVALGRLTVDPINSAGLVNNGTLTATNNSTLTISGLGGGSFNNGASGRMIADAATIEFTSAPLITGGTFSTLNGGTIVATGLSSSTIRNVANQGALFVQNGSGVNFEGTINNTGTITVNGTGGSTLFTVSGGTVTLDGGGTVALTHSLATLNGSGTLVTNNTIGGFGNVGFNNVIIHNSGTINAIGGTLTIDGGNNAPLINTGTMLASSGGTLAISGFGGGAFDSTGGTILAQSGGTVSIIQNPTLNAATVSLDGNWTMPGGAVSLGRVEGTGMFTQTGGTTSTTRMRITSASVSAGTISINPNGVDADSVSKLATISVTVSGRFDLNDNDLIVTTTPKATVQALIVAARNNGSWNGVGITSSMAKNASPKVTTLGMMSGADWFSATSNGNPFDGQSVVNTDTLIKYTYYGDANFNGKVDGGDYARIDTTFALETGMGNIGGWINGDFDFNGKVDGADYGLIDFAFSSQSGTLAGLLAIVGGDDPGQGTSIDSDPFDGARGHLAQFGDLYSQTILAQVPEPASISIISAAALHVLLRRRRSSRTSESV